MIRIYHNPQCKKSRAGLEYLKNSGLDFELVEYLKKPLSREQLQQIIKKSGLEAKNLIRTQEEVYKTNYKELQLSDDQWIEAIIQFPKLLKRPFVESADKAVLADPPENIQLLLNKIK